MPIFIELVRQGRERRQHISWQPEEDECMQASTQVNIFNKYVLGPWNMSGFSLGPRTFSSEKDQQRFDLVHSMGSKQQMQKGVISDPKSLRVRDSKTM
jgi:hypothetical protein